MPANADRSGNSVKHIVQYDQLTYVEAIESSDAVGWSKAMEKKPSFTPPRNFYSHQTTSGQQGFTYLAFL